jgi:hypothetical protein
MLETGRRSYARSIPGLKHARRAADAAGESEWFAARLRSAGTASRSSASTTAAVRRSSRCSTRPASDDAPTTATRRSGTRQPPKSVCRSGTQVKADAGARTREPLAYHASALPTELRRPAPRILAVPGGAAGSIGPEPTTRDSPSSWGCFWGLPGGVLGVFCSRQTVPRSPFRHRKPRQDGASRAQEGLHANHGKAGVKGSSPFVGSVRELVLFTANSPAGRCTICPRLSASVPGRRAAEPQSRSRKWHCA